MNDPMCACGHDVYSRGHFIGDARRGDEEFVNACNDCDDCAEYSEVSL
jgi:hypothetical protein